jgi:RNA polymerase sigma factor (sigma-70 family)
MAIHPIPKSGDPSSMRRNASKASIPALLAALGETPEESGIEYERLRSKLILFFSRRMLQFPEDLADEALDRLARRIVEGTIIDSIPAFALGIGRHLALEQMKNRAETMGDDFWDNVPAPSATQSSEEEIARMERCLKTLRPDEAKLLRGYYLATEDTPMKTRGKLAKRLGISANTLRQRVFLARQRLRDCMTSAVMKRR